MKVYYHVTVSHCGLIAIREENKLEIDLTEQFHPPNSLKLVFGRWVGKRIVKGNKLQCRNSGGVMLSGYIPMTKEALR